MTKITASQRQEIVDLFAAGMTRAELAIKFGVVYSHIHQIIKKPVPDTSRRTLRFASAWGVSVEEYEAHVDQFGNSADLTSPMHKYAEHRANAARRGIEWQFDFKSWWATWQESGKWAERGPGEGYVMARCEDGDTPYSPGTVYICKNAKNVTDSFVNVPMDKRNRPKRGAGRGLGYSVDKKGGTKPYIASFRNKTLGRFATTELARAAYLAAAEAHKRSQA